MIDPWRGPAFGYTATDQQKCTARCNQGKGGTNDDTDWIPFWKHIHSTGQCSEACNSNTSANVVDVPNMRIAKQNIAKAKDRATLVRKMSHEAAPQYPDGYFDFIYLDAVHTKDGLLDDMRIWYSKLRCGGMFAGDDWGDRAHDTDFMTREKSQRLYGGAPDWGVTSAATEFARSVGVQLMVTHAGGLGHAWECRKVPSWYLVKS